MLRHASWANKLMTGGQAEHNTSQRSGTRPLQCKPTLRPGHRESGITASFSCRASPVAPFAQPRHHQQQRAAGQQDLHNRRAGLAPDEQQRALLVCICQQLCLLPPAFLPRRFSLSARPGKDGRSASLCCGCCGGGLPLQLCNLLLQLFRGRLRRHCGRAGASRRRYGSSTGYCASWVRLPPFLPLVSLRLPGTLGARGSRGWLRRGSPRLHALS